MYIYMDIMQGAMYTLTIHFFFQQNIKSPQKIHCNRFF